MKSLLRLPFSFLLVILLPGGFVLAPATGGTSIHIPDGLPDIEIPVELVSLDPASEVPALLVTGVESGGGGLILQNTPALFSNSGNEMGRSYCTLLPRNLSGGVRPVRVLAPRDAEFSFAEKEGGKLLLREGARPVLVYNFGIQSRAGVSEDRYRSTYIHPVYDLMGQSLTDDFPQDHYHHRGLSWMWPHVQIGGRLQDLWHIRGIRQHFVGWLAQEIGPVCATLGAKNVWRLADRQVLEEWVWVRAFRASESGRAVDLSLTWRASEPVILRGEETKGYGGLCFRLAPCTETVLSGPGGRLQADSDLMAIPWAGQTGRFGSGGLSGVAIFQHRTNPGFPAGWCLRHYGFLGVSWPGLEEFTLDPSDPLTLRFRIWIHNGDSQNGRVEEAFRAFAKVSDVKLVTD